TLAVTCASVRVQRVGRRGCGAGFSRARPAMAALVRAQPGASASVTTAWLRFESPSLMTWIVELAVWPATIVWESGVFRIVMCGLITSTASSVHLLEAGTLLPSPEYLASQW